MSLCSNRDLHVFVGIWGLPKSSGEGRHLYIKLLILYKAKLQLHLSLILNGNRSLQTREVGDCRNLTLRFWVQTGKHETAQGALQKWGAWSFSKNPEKPKIGDMRWPPQPDTHFAQARGGKAENLQFFIDCIYCLYSSKEFLVSPLSGGKIPPDWSLLPDHRAQEPQHWLFISASSPPAAKPFTGATNCAQKPQNVTISVSHPKTPPDNTAAQNIAL